MFNKAIVKLTAIYMVILICIIAIFSLVLYGITENNMAKRNFHINSKSNYELLNENIELQVNQRDKEIKSGIAKELIWVDIAVFMTGSVVCYFLSKKTLKPIHKAYQAQEQFVSDASHELRTPLTSMYMENEIILRDNKTSKDDFIILTKSNLEEIQKLQSLTNNLLNLNKNDQFDLIDVDIKNIIDDVIESLKIPAKNKKIVIKNNVESKIIKAEPFAFNQIITILIDNAIKYSDENKKIKVISNNQNVSVVDEGCGISKEDLPYIFDRFYRADKSRNTEGFGLGLSMAQKLANKMNMNITAQNNEKTGAIFTINFNQKSKFNINKK